MTQDAIRYNCVARALHWSIGLLIIVNLALGLLHDPLEHLMWIIPIHQSIGLLVLALSLFRLFWRFSHKVPPLPAAMPGWEKAGSHITHGALYILMLLVPLAGWVMSSASKWPIGFFFLFTVPKFAVTKEDAIAHLAHDAHGVMGLLFIPLLLLHIGAALRHHFILKDDVLLRMTGRPLNR